MSDIYCHPEHFGLTVVKEITDPHASYSFDTVVLWADDDGDLFAAGDSGCSCPLPFESYNLSNITPIRALPDIEPLLDGYCPDGHWVGCDWMEGPPPEVVMRRHEMRVAVIRHLAGRRLESSE